MKPGDFVMLLSPWDAFKPGEQMVEAIAPDRTVTISGADYAPEFWVFSREGEPLPPPASSTVEVVIGGVSIPLPREAAEALTQALQSAAI